MGLGKWTGEDDLSLHKQILFLAHAERWGSFAIHGKSRPSTTRESVTKVTACIVAHRQA